MRRYSYISFSVETVLWATNITPREKDSFISWESGFEQVRQALSRGYRWVRTDTVQGAQWAILEREERICNTCNGTGQIVENPEALPDDYDKGTKPCPICNGTGSTVKD